MVMHILTLNYFNCTRKESPKGTLPGCYRGVYYSQVRVPQFQTGTVLNHNAKHDLTKAHIFTKHLDNVLKNT